MIGLLIVAAGAAGFGVVLFGRGAAVQTDTRRPSALPITWSAEAGASTAAVDRGGSRIGRRFAHWRARRSPDLVPSGWVRVRSALVLALTVLGIAAMVGVILSVAVVAVVFLAT